MMTFETRPSEPGFSGRVDSATLRKMTESINPEPVSGAFRGPTATVKSAQFIGFDVHGRKVYKVAVSSAGGTSFMTRVWTGSNFTKAAKLRGTESTPDIDSGGGSGQREQQKQEAALRVAEDRWMTAISGMTLSPFQKENLKRVIRNHRGDAESLNQKMAQLVKRTHGEIDGELPDQPQDQGFSIDDLFGGGGFGGGGGGLSGPTYVEPDERVVEDQVKGALVSLLGNIPSETMVDQFTELYLTDDRRNFDNPEQEIDPAQSVREAIRETDHYKTIHQLRPDSEDERAWVAERRAAAQQGGLDTGQQEDFAITQATVGGDLQDVQTAAAVRQTKRSGTTRGTSIENRMRQTAQNVFAGVVR